MSPMARLSSAASHLAIVIHVDTGPHGGYRPADLPGFFPRADPVLVSDRTLRSCSGGESRATAGRLHGGLGWCRRSGRLRLSIAVRHWLSGPARLRRQSARPPITVMDFDLFMSVSPFPRSLELLAAAAGLGRAGFAGSAPLPAGITAAAGVVLTWTTAAGVAGGCGTAALSAGSPRCPRSGPAMRAPAAPVRRLFPRRPTRARLPSSMSHA